MEWAILALFALGATTFIAWPRRGDALGASPESEGGELAGEREALLLALRELDEDASAGRISAEDRVDGRRALGPRLREVTEALRALDDAGGRP
ncbi:MAG: hypothetical protein EPO65_03725 [Dehalococcoidia bacterium]|nr:MAG: hypothetical protein EPO65_03725 [Dehalococcoidia bacterium]